MNRITAQITVKVMIHPLGLIGPARSLEFRVEVVFFL
jgi:hypothetical protein